MLGGYGLMHVLDVDHELGVAAMLGHGCRSPHWFHLSRIGAHATVAIVERERFEAHTRRVDCNSPGCWCRAVNCIACGLPRSGNRFAYLALANPRYLAYCYPRTPEEQRKLDEVERPGGCMIGFILWNGARWREFCALHKVKNPDEVFLKYGTDEGQRMYNAWLLARVELTAWPNGAC